ncbi:MAG: cupin domain-containing protein [Hyphomicrobiaceae bacterium]
MIETHLLPDDGLVPNNPRLPLIVMAGVVGPDQRGAAAIIARLGANGWRGAWVNGIYPFHHFHARAHEVLVVARGTARVQFGGASGPVVDLAAGDAVVIPAGVGHCRRAASADLSVVGAYPAGQEDWDLKRATVADHARALREIADVALPARDPLDGDGGAVVKWWLAA